MGILSWPLHKLMSLPDCCFGRRFLISCSLNAGAGIPAWDISEISFPEQTVIWEIRAYCELAANLCDHIRIALGDQIPATVAAMDVLDPLIAGLGLTGPEPREIKFSMDGTLSWTNLRFGLAAAGKNLVVEAQGSGENTPRITVGVVVSSVPKEVPEWLISGQGKSQ